MTDRSCSVCHSTTFFTVLLVNLFSSDVRQKPGFCCIQHVTVFCYKCAIVTCKYDCVFLFMAVELVHNIFYLVLLYCFVLILRLYFLLDFVCCPDLILAWSRLTCFRDDKFAAAELFAVAAARECFMSAAVKRCYQSPWVAKLWWRFNSRWRNWFLAAETFFCKQCTRLNTLCARITQNIHHSMKWHPYAFPLLNISENY